MTAKKASKAPVEEVAPAAVPPVEETQAAAAEGASETAAPEVVADAPPVEETLTLEQYAAGAAAVAKQEHGYFGEPASVMVLVGPNGAAGRIVLGRVAYDMVTPRAMSRADFERLRGAYDLREA